MMSLSPEATAHILAYGIEREKAINTIARDLKCLIPNDVGATPNVPEA
jgi:hypothetical protein